MPGLSRSVFLILLAGYEDAGKLSHATLKNGHTTPIGSARSSSPVLVEEEPVRVSSLRNLTPEEDSKKRLGKSGFLSLKAIECFHLPQRTVGERSQMGRAIHVLEKLQFSALVTPSHSPKFLNL